MPDCHPCAAVGRTEPVQIEQQDAKRERQQEEIPGSLRADLPTEDRRGQNRKARAVADRRLVLAHANDNDEVRRQRADGEIKAFQTQRGQSDRNAENGADHGSGRQRDGDRSLDMRDQRRHRERARCHEAGVTERNLPGRARQQVERQRADDGNEDLVGNAGPEVRQGQRQQKRNDQACGSPETYKSGVEQLDVVAEICPWRRGMPAPAHMRSSSSRAPKMPHGRIHSATSSTRNGAASATWGAIYSAARTSAAATITAPMRTPLRLSMPPISAGAKPARPTYQISGPSRALIEKKMPATAAITVAAAHEKALMRWMLMPRCAASKAFSATPRISIPTVDSRSSRGKPTMAMTAAAMISVSMPLTLTPANNVIGRPVWPSNSAG